MTDVETAAIVQANLGSVGIAPSIAIGEVYQGVGQALSNAAQNATYAQQQTYAFAQAVTTMGVAAVGSLTAVMTAQASGGGK